MRIINVLAFLVMSIGVWAQNPSESKHLPGLLNSVNNSIIKSGNFKTSHSFIDQHNGVSHAYGFQTVNGIEIEHAVFDAHAQKGKVVAFHNSFVAASQLKNIANHKLSKTNALDAVIAKYKGHFNNTTTSSLNWVQTTPNQYVAENQDLSSEKIRIKKSYIFHNNQLQPTWSVSLLLPDESHWYYTVVSAINAEIIWQVDYMLECNFNHDHGMHAFEPSTGNKDGSVARKKADGASYNAYPFQVESPNHGSREILKDPAHPTASPYGWHDIDGFSGAEYTITRGNNVWARDDVDGSNATEGASPDGGEDLVFDFSYSADSTHNSNQAAAITNLFVRNNYMHDFLYQYGFDEESGNFQENNYGNHSTGDGDYVFADAQDGGGTNNANFATPPDGNNPRMQMYLWGSSSSGITLDVLEGSTNEGSYTAFGANFGNPLTEKPIKGKLVMVSDGTTDSTLGCNELVNSEALVGNIALIERGTCLFVDKVRNAQDAGAIAVIIFTDNRQTQTIFGTNANDIEIPSIMIDRGIGLSLMSEVANTDVEVAMYVKGATGGYDGDFDNGVIAHEYGHGISIRLTGGALNSACLTNTEQMGEGWSDFFALVTTHRKGDKPTDLRGIGTYVTGQPTNGSGIRTYPYSTDESRSEYTYEDVSRLSVPHGIGSVWCSMLWDMYWNFVDKYGFDEDIFDGSGGNNIAIQLVVDGMKLQPCNPGFSEARDAILLADELNNDGANQKLIWEAFAKRGLGYNSDDGDSDDRTDGKNGFDLPPQYQGIILVEKTADAQIGEDEELVYTVVFENASNQTYYDVVITDTIPELLELDLNSLNCDWDVNGNILSITLDSLQAETKFECTYVTTAKPGIHSKIYAQDGAESDVDWSVSNDLGTNPWRLQGTSVAEGSFAWYVDNVDYESDQSVIYNIGLVDEGAILSFQHRYNTSYRRDGGVVEFSSDEGQTWVDAGPYFVENGYVGNIAVAQTLKGRDAFTGDNGDFERSQIDLFEFAGKEIQVRFRFATDRAISGEGWYVDDLQVVRFSGVTNTLWASQSGNVSFDAVNTLILETDGEGNSINELSYPLGATVYPNPAGNQTVVSIAENIAGATLSITDVNGKEIMSKTLVSGKNIIGVSELSKGSYIITITHNQITEKHQLVKQ
ncbi:MAG: M36 family metallopeptidase [Bacteroidia bacterium]